MKRILLIIFIIIVCCIVISASTMKSHSLITGGLAAAAISLNPNHALIDSNSTIVFDCHNMIHNLQNDDTFSNNLRYLSQIISTALSGYNLHFVIKNPNDTILDYVINTHTDKPTDRQKDKPVDKPTDRQKDKPVDKPTDKQKDKPVDKPTDKQKDKPVDKPVDKPTKKYMLLEYFNQLVTLGKSFPNITYHLAQGNEPKTNRNHYLKGRDDFLAIYLAKDQYVVSQDRYKDFSSFDNIKPFYHLSTKAGTIFKKTKIDPKAYFARINKPTTGSHLTYQFVTKTEASELGVKSGDIIVEKPGVLTKLYLIKL